MTSLRFALRRIRAKPVLSLLLLVGSAAAIAIPMAIPVYADAATVRVLATQDFADRGYRPPFAYLFWYSGDPVDWDSVEGADAYLRQEGLHRLGLPAASTTSFVDTRRFALRHPDPDQDLPATPLAALDDFADRARFVAGRAPAPAGSSTIEAAIPASWALDRGLAVGDVIEAFDPEATLGDPMRTFPVTVVGVWEPAAEDDPHWIIAPNQLANRLMVDRSAIVEVLSPLKSDLIRTAGWYAILDAGSITPAAVGPLLAGADNVLAEAAERLPGMTRATDPVDGLRDFAHTSETLERRLLAYALPTLGVVAIFVMLAVSLTTAERRQELAVLRSRGAGRGQLVVAVAVEAALITGAAFVAALPLALGIAAAMGRTDTFLGMGGAGSLPVQLSWAAVRPGLIVAVVTVVAQVIPVFGAARATVVTQDDFLTAAGRRPWWQRTSIDLLVIAVALAVGYVLYSSDPDLGSDLADPAIVLLPALVTLAAGLVVLRLLPFLLEMAARALRLTSSQSALIAFRRAARSPGSSHVPLLLLVVTVGLAIFTASLARTLDLQLADEAFHAVGADWSVQEPDSVRPPNIDGVPTGARVLAPLSEFEATPGIAQATRVGRYPARVGDGGSTATATLFGVEADTFAEVAFFRSDFATAGTVPERLAALRTVPEAALVHPSLGFDVGDVIETVVPWQGQTLTTRLVVAGHLDMFPTWTPGEDAFVVANLDHLFDETGDPAGYHVWLRTDGTDTAADELDTPIALVSAASPLPTIAAALAQPDRQGVFGLLTAGFLVALALSLIGFFFATMFRVRMSIVELGALQALGMPPRRVAAVVVVELGVLMAAGLACGVATGLWLSRWMIVRLVGDSGLTATPPLLAELDRLAAASVTAALLVLFAVTSVALVLVLRRLRVFEALKMGENR